MPMIRFISLASAAFLIFGILGCGGDDVIEGPPTHKVTGTVTLDGTPVAKGEISFESEEDTKVGVSSVAEIKDGKYEVAATVGKKKVKISARTETGPKDATGVAPSKESIPAKYNEQTTLEFEVKEGENKKDFDLKS
jgi:hypothetical protein